MTQEPDYSHLTPAECVRLAEQLWEQARAHAEAIPVTPAQRDEIGRRLDALDAGTMGPGEPWSVVRERLWRR
jgi:putative addiction module component (TIGR02574 family)